MFKNIINNNRIAFLSLLLLMYSVAVPAQTEKLSTQELKLSAAEDMKAGSYESAYEKYQILIGRYPKDGLFNYYAGVCLYEAKKDPGQSISYLNAAAGKSTVPSEVFYYLGLAYRKNYQFQESKTAFSRYAQAASKNELKERMPAREAEMSASASELTQNYNPFEVQAASLFSFSDSTHVKLARGKGGILGRKPESLFSAGEGKDDFTAFVFQPVNAEKGDYVYFSGYGKTGKKNGSDIFRVKKIIGNTWGKPEAVSGVNTPYDEILPYYDPVSKDLYFASKGYNSMGGYDVFKSHYDEERDLWSEPINMGFPVNSPSNDFLVIPGAMLGSLTLISDRQGLDSLMTVYRLIMKDAKQSLAASDLKEKKRVGNLGGVEPSSTLANLEMAKDDKVENLSDVTQTSLPPSTEIKESITTFQFNLSTALRFQVMSDSLTNLAREGRIRTKTIDDANARWEIQKNIVDWEKTASEYQSKADTIYKELHIDTKKTVPTTIPPAIKKDTVINEIAVYHFKQEVMAIEKPEVKEEKPPLVQSFPVNEPGSVVKPPETKSNNVSRFMVLDASPYNDNNPFPVDTPLPQGPFYRIQLGVFSQKVEWNAFKGISPITAETVPGRTMTRYYAGKFNTYDEAINALGKVKQSGFRDAFIVAWYNGEKMTVERVIEFEKRDR
jgi:tetratricopeptide (TPR) repeat protein